MNDPSVQHSSVPWSERDVWLGVEVFGVWLLGAVGFVLLIRSQEWEMNVGVFATLWEFLLIVPTWWFTIKKYKVDWSTLGLRRFGIKTLGIGFGLLVLSFAFNMAYGLILSLFDLQPQLDWGRIFDELSSPWILFVGGVVVAPVVEELFFRGFVFAGLRQRMGWERAGVISAGLFALVHLQPLQIIPIFILGLIFAYLYHRSESIWPAVLMHVVTNGLGLGVAYFETQLNV